MSDFEQHDEHDPTFLASIYLDGEATADQRALVETSPEALAQIERLGQVRTVLTGTAPMASLSEREGHLAAALDVFGRMSDRERAGEATPSDGIDAAAAAAVTTPISDARRGRADRRTGRSEGAMSRSQWMLGAAAGLVLLAGVGAVVLNVLADRGDDSEPVAVEAVQDDPTSEAEAVEAAEAAEVRGDDVGADLEPTASDLSEQAAESGGLFPEDDQLAEADVAADSADESASAPGAEQPAPPPDSGELLPIETPEDLGIYATLAVPALDETNQPNEDIEFEPPLGTCEADLGVEVQLEPVIYQGVEVVVGIDVDRSIVLAYTADDCDVVERVSLPDDTRGQDVATDTQP